MNIIKSFLLACLPLVFLTHLFVQEMMPNRASYSFRLNILDCDNVEPLKGCRHEIGHKMDDDRGMPSQTAEFLLAVRVYELVELNARRMPSDMAILIHLYPDRNPVELYAAIYSRVDGDVSKMPESLQPFYSTDPAYLDLYDCLARVGQINICDGQSFSYLGSN